LNGTRVTDDIMHLIPNIPNFQQTLRCIKAWAKKRGIYSNVLGYPGGVAWAIVTARTCQFFPNACPAVLVEKFFWFCEKWDWDKFGGARNAIKLRKEQNLAIRDDIRQFHEQVEDEPDKINWMPIITPTYPDTNTTFNVFESTIWVIRKEFTRGRKITEAIRAGDKNYADLLEPKCFFSKRSDPSYKTFIEVVAQAGDEMSLLVFKGVVQSSIRKFIDKVMAHRDGLNPHVVLVPCTREFKRPREAIKVVDEEGEEIEVEVASCSWFLGVTWRNDVKPNEGGELDIKGAKEQLQRDILRKQYLDQKSGWNMYGDITMTHDIKIYGHREKLPEYTGYSYAQEKAEIKEEKRQEKRRLKALKAKGLLPPPGAVVVKTEPGAAATVAEAAAAAGAGAGAGAGAAAAVVAPEGGGGGGDAVPPVEVVAPNAAGGGGAGAAVMDQAADDDDDAVSVTKRKREDDATAGRDGGSGGGGGGSAEEESGMGDAKKAKSLDSPQKGTNLEDVDAAWQTSATATDAVAAKILKMETSSPKPKFSLQLGGL